MADRMKKIAVVTGASSGMGQEFCRQLDVETSGEGGLFPGEKLDELWVIARREDRLKEIQDMVSIPVRVLAYDLTDPESIREIRENLEEEKPDVRFLVNAAGYGKIGPTPEMPLSDIDGMINLNCRAAVDMTQICIPFMHEKARILEICSTAAFQPLTYLNVYAASKAFLYRYSRALRVELLSKKIYVTAVCPFWVKDTEFIATAKKSEGSDGIHSFPFATTKYKVVHSSLTDAAIGMPVSTPGPFCTVHRFARKCFSSDILLGFWELMRRA